jgi:ubiquinone biosynthesis protein Coq4/ribosomal protein S18 acetylase RimI-like enzyme
LYVTAFKEVNMQVPSMTWLQERLGQLRGMTPTQEAAIASLGSFLNMFDCQINELDDFATLAEMSRALIRTEAQAQMVQVLKTDPACAVLMAERFLPRHPDVATLRQYPPHSLGGAYAAWLQSAELYSDLYSDILIEDDASYVEARLGQTHDIWHLITGFDTSAEAEIGLQAFHLAQFPYPLAALLIANALVSQTLFEPEKLPQLLAAIAQGWTLGQQAQPLFVQKWEQAWEKPLDQWRQELNLVIPSIHDGPEGDRFVGTFPQRLNQRRESLIQAEVQIRKAAIADIPFLARIMYEAALPPLNHCFWEDLLQDTGNSSLQFIEAMLQVGASNWGNVSDFLVLEWQDQPVGAAAGYPPNQEDYCPLHLSHLDQIAQILNWSQSTATAFGDRYLEFWGGDFQPIFLTPIAPWIIENVAVLPEMRGRGLGKILLKALLEEGRSQQYSHAGIMVINGNEVALHAYESLGFQACQTFHAEYFSQQFNVEFLGVTKLGLCLVLTDSLGN